MAAVDTASGIRLLGLPSLRGPAGEQPLPPHRPQQLLAYLACRRGWVARSELAELFWPDRPEGAARGNLRTLLLRLQRLGLSPPLELQSERVRWLPASDLAHFEAAATSAAEDEALLALPWAPLLDGLEPGLPEPVLQWLARERERLAALRRAAAHRRMAALQAEDPAAARRLAERLLEQEPWDPSALRVLADSALALGEAQQGIDTLQAHAHRLRDDPAAGGQQPPAVWRAALARVNGAGISSGAATAAQPPMLTSERFVGRRAELVELVARLQQPGVRQLQLLGPGGIGKTALALAALPLLEPQFEAGAHWVALADLTDAAQVPARVVQALGRSLSASPGLWEQVAAAIGPRRLLLVMDNAEHLPALAPALDMLLAACPGVRLLSTSRLRSAAADGRASVLLLEGLPLPDPDDTDADSLRRFDAVRLFEARALAVDPGFRLAPQAAAVVALLHATEGLPLAVELAAAMLRLLPAAEIVQALAESLDALDAGAPRGLRACFERSWALLGPGQRAALARLAALPGAFGREMAKHVAGAALPTLVALHDASLLQTAAGGRWTLHPLLRQYVVARQPLPAAAAAALAAQHSAFVAHQVESFDRPGALGSGAQLDALEPELPHLRAAWRHSVQHGPAVRAGQFARLMGRYAESRGRAQELLPLLAELVALFPAETRPQQRARALTLRTQAMLEFYAGQLQPARAHARQALRWATQAADPATAMACLTVLGNATFFAGQAAQARPHFEQALKRAQRLDDVVIASAAHNGLGLVARSLGQPEAALAHYEEAVALSRSIGDHGAALSTLNNLGNLLYLRGRPREALARFQQALQLAQAERIEAQLALLQTNIAASHLELGELDAAASSLAAATEALPFNRAVMVPTEILLAHARLAAARGRHGEAARHWAEAAETATAAGSVMLQLRCVTVQGLLDLAVGDTAGALQLWRWVQRQPGCDAAMHAAVQQRIERAGTATTPPPRHLPDALPALLRMLGG